MKIEIECDGECESCFFDWRNAQYNPDCFLSETISHIVNKSEHVKWIK